MKSLPAAAALVLLSAPLAFAADGEDPAKKPAPDTPPAPAAPGAEAKAPVKKERKVDPAAAKALERYISLLHLPVNAGLKSVAGKGGLEQMGMTIGLDPSWTAEKGFDLTMTFPPQIVEQIEAQGMSAEDAVKGQKSQMILFTGLPSAFEAPGKDWSHYDVSFKQTGDDQSVELTPFDDEASAESKTYVFGKDGLLKSTSVAPKEAQIPGMTFDSEWTFEKRGERNVVSGRTLSVMGTEIGTKFTYFDGPNGSYLLKDATLTTPQGEEVISFHDYVVDGKLAESTATAAPKAAEKPNTETPAPAPAPEPKDGGK